LLSQRYNLGNKRVTGNVNPLLDDIKHASTLQIDERTEVAVTQAALLFVKTQVGNMTALRLFRPRSTALFYAAST
jgi:hypothetical protein